jgi:hypothetical protein
MPGRGDLPEDALPDKCEPFVTIEYAHPDADEINALVDGYAREHDGGTSRSKRASRKEAPQRCRRGVVAEIGGRARAVGAEARRSRFSLRNRCRHFLPLDHRHVLRSAR